jgi:CheY-like chemotaxis protein
MVDPARFKVIRAASSSWSCLGAAWPQIPRQSSFRLRQGRSQQSISRAKEHGVRHGSIIESPNREAQTGTEGQRHILVVDDDPMVCMAIEVYLQRNDFRVTIAEGGEAGLRALEHEQFDLMIIDIFMPHMRGFESVRIFHERAPAVPLIAMSGYAFANLNSPAPDFLRMALELGAARCLRKPFTPHALLAAITDCLAEHRPHGDLASAARLG